MAIDLPLATKKLSPIRRASRDTLLLRRWARHQPIAKEADWRIQLTPRRNTVSVQSQYKLRATCEVLSDGNAYLTLSIHKENIWFKLWTDLDDTFRQLGRCQKRGSVFKDIPCSYETSLNTLSMTLFHI